MTQSNQMSGLPVSNSKVENYWGKPLSNIDVNITGENLFPTYTHTCTQTHVQTRGHILLPFMPEYSEFHTRKCFYTQKCNLLLWSLGGYEWQESSERWNYRDHGRQNGQFIFLIKGSLWNVCNRVIDVLVHLVHHLVYWPERIFISDNLAIIMWKA